jgi:hypothetical protein
MAGTTPGWGQPATPGGPGGQGRARLIVTLVAIGLAALLVSGAASFGAAGGFNPQGGQSEDCGGVNRCIPSLRSGDVISALEAKGFTCTPDSGGSCELQFGNSRFEMSMDTAGENDDQIASIITHVTIPPGVQRGGRIIPYFVWFASLPYADDPVLVQEVTAWIQQQVDGGTDAEALIGGYRYNVAASSPTSIELQIQGTIQG